MIIYIDVISETTDLKDLGEEMCGDIDELADILMQSKLDRMFLKANKD